MKADDAPLGDILAIPESAPGFHAFGSQMDGMGAARFSTEAVCRARAAVWRKIVKEIERMQAMEPEGGARL